MLESDRRMLPGGRVDVMNDVSWGEERALRREARWLGNCIRSGRVSEAWLPLRHAAQSAATRQTLIALDKLLEEYGKPPLRR